jgi:hypothetical protein
MACTFDCSVFKNNILGEDQTRKDVEKILQHLASSMTTMIASCHLNKKRMGGRYAQPILMIQ